MKEAGTLAIRFVVRYYFGQTSQMHQSAEQSVESKYEIHPQSLNEIATKEAEGWIFVHAEHDLSKLGEQTGVVDIANQCANGNVEKVLLCDLDAICKVTQKAVGLRLYFVEKWQFKEACRQKTKRRREKEREQKNVKQHPRKKT